MYINQVFELSMVLDNEKFQNVLNRVRRKNGYMEENEDGYIDRFLSSKGVTVMYRDSQYKKKIKLIVEPRLILDSKQTDSDRFIRKLDKRIDEYFDSRYNGDDFDLSGVTLSTDIDVHSHENVSAYLKVLQRIGRVKGFSPADYDCFGDVDSFCLEGNSNNITFWIYNLEGLLVNRIRNEDIGPKKIKSMLKESEGILRAEVRLTKPKAVRVYTDAVDVYGQIADLSQKSQPIFLDMFAHIIPFGDYYKKGRAVEIIQNKVSDSILRRRMLHLLTLIPEKKSLYLAQKAMNCRSIEKVMEEFSKINLSPVTISKRHYVQHLKNLYSYLFEKD
ncbi:MAG: hypothetical protein K2N34_10995 [Lachnospiraceae bacterium]|nr:hypothetical protein [Lachnospiraceae bacterium]